MAAPEAYDVSGRRLERSEVTDEIVYGDLVEGYHTNLDFQCLDGSGSSGQLLGLLNTPRIEAVTYTDASPSVGEAFAKIADAVQRINSLRFLPASAIWMHPHRWGWFTCATDTQGRPLVGPEAPANPVGVFGRP